MPDRSLTCTGPFTDDEILDIVAVVQRIEKTRPTETFAVNMEAPDATWADYIMGRIPVPPGYARTWQVIRTEDSDV
jgi:hypothetical protein